MTKTSEWIKLQANERANRYLNERYSHWLDGWSARNDMPATAKKKSVQTRPQGLEGKWKIIEMPDLTEDYLSESKDPHIKITVYKRGGVSGRYQYGLCEGEIDGEVVAGTEGKPPGIRFSFEGLDEMEQVSGYGVATLSDDNKTLTGKLHYHMGDDWRFTCRRT